MAQITDGKKTIQIKDGESVISACEELGVPFACQNGVCGTCRSEVLEGMDNLSPRNEAEESMGVEGKERLMCQCKIKKGSVKIKF